MLVWTVYDALYENVVGVFSSEEAADDFGAWYGRLWLCCPRVSKMRKNEKGGDTHG